MKTLLLDIGNSWIKWGVHEGETIRRARKLRHSVIHEQGLAALASKLPRAVDAVFACNVAGDNFSTRVSRAVGAHCDCDVRFARSESQACGVSNGYRRPRQLGVDRWVAMIAARSMCDTSCVVVDAGTAITIDVLNNDGQHLGGQILPGLGLMTESLASSTSDLPDVSWRISRNSSGLDIFASKTSAAISLGAVGAAVGAVERATRVLRDAGFEPTIFLTGGDARHILEPIEEEAVNCPHLVLQGLARMVENQCV